METLSVNWTLSSDPLLGQGRVPRNVITLLSHDTGPGFQTLLHEPKTEAAGPFPFCLPIWSVGPSPPGPCADPVFCDSQPGEGGGEGSCLASSPEQSPIEPRFLWGGCLPSLWQATTLYLSCAHPVSDLSVLCWEVGWEGKEEIKEEEEERGGGGKTA